MVESKPVFFEDLFSPTDIDDENKKVLEAFKRIELTAASARQCINTQCFASYKENLERALGGMVDVMCAYTAKFIASDQVSADKYAMVMVRYVTRIDSLRSILKQVELDASKGINKTEIKDEKEQ